MTSIDQSKYQAESHLNKDYPVSTANTGRTELLKSAVLVLALRDTLNRKNIMTLNAYLYPGFRVTDAISANLSPGSFYLATSVLDYESDRGG